MSLSFATLAKETGIPLPDLLQQLQTAGKTIYSPEWSSTWREIILTNPPALASCYDFWWLDVASSKRTIAEWLKPQFQGGRSFLPFGENGAGDVFCLMPIDSQSTGVALILHDDDNSEILYRSFADFICASFLKTFADMSHLLRHFTQQEALEIVKTDVFHVSEYLDHQTREYLRSFCHLPVVCREYRDGPQSAPRLAPSFITQDQLSLALLKFPAPSAGPFPVVAQWDISP